MAILVASLMVVAAPAFADTITVNSFDDSSGGSACTLRDAIIAANTDAIAGGCVAGRDADTIVFANGGVIRLDATLPGVGSAITIDAGAHEVVIHGNNTVRVAEVLSGQSLTVIGVLIMNGLSAAGGGGAILVRNRGRLVVARSRFLGNTSTGGGGGAISAEEGSIEIIDSTFLLNRAVEGGAVHLPIRGGMAVVRSTFASNEAATGSAISVGIGTRLTLLNSTISRNLSEREGGTVYVNGSATINHSTIADNVGVGVSVGQLGSMAMSGSILAYHRAGDCVSQSGRPVVTSSVNIVTGGRCDIPGAINGDPRLVTIANNGGPTDTRALLPGSPAIDAGDPGVCATLDTDQRGRPRSLDGDLDGNEVCDLGAFEYANQAPVAVTDAYAGEADTPLTVAAPGVLGNDRDAEGNAISAALATPPAHAAAFSLSANGSFTYTPAAGYVGTDSFTYSARDAGGASVEVVATIAVTAPTCGIDIAPAAIAQPYVAIPYLQSIGSSDGGKYTYHISAGALPPGLQFVSALGVSRIVGIPQTPGSYSFTVTATKAGTNCRAPRNYTVTIPTTVVPLLTCVQKINKTTYRATFGFSNTTGAGLTIPTGTNNYFTPGAQQRGQPTMFSSGTIPGAFTVTFTVARDDNDIALWVLRGPDNQRRIVTVTRATYGCQ